MDCISKSTLARRPVHAPLAEKVDVQVMDGLSPVLSGVDDDPVAIFKSQRGRDLLYLKEHVGEELSVFVGTISTWTGAWGSRS